MMVERHSRLQRSLKRRRVAVGCAVKYVNVGGETPTHGRVGAWRRGEGHVATLVPRAQDSNQRLLARKANRGVLQTMKNGNIMG